VKKVSVDRLGMTHVRVQQFANGAPVLGAEAIVHLNTDGSLFGITNDLLGSTKAATAPTISAEKAISLAARIYGCTSCLSTTPQADLVVLRQDGRDFLAYRVSMRREDGSADTALPIFFMDATTGKKLFAYDNLQTAIGSSLYDGKVEVGSYTYKEGTFLLEDLERGIGVFSGQNLNTFGAFERIIDTDNYFGSRSQRAAVSAQFAMGAFMDYFADVHNRQGIDGQGGLASMVSFDGTTKLVASKVHYGRGYSGGFWNGSFASFGDGDGTAMGPAVSIDLVAHELSHGLIESSAGLLYFGESGALNESFSDVFGALVERHVRGDSQSVWQIGEDAFTPSVTGDSIRNIADPKKGGFRETDQQPDFYGDRFRGVEDNGGVHINSGIANKAFFLTAVGGAHRDGSVEGIGVDAAAEIWYLAVTEYMTSATDFSGARQATISAATALFGADSAQAKNVSISWDLVGVR
jgi:thermolysin